MTVSLFKAIASLSLSRKWEGYDGVGANETDERINVVNL
jgi:hypothetical protein